MQKAPYLAYKLGGRSIPPTVLHRHFAIYHNWPKHDEAKASLTDFALKG